MERFPAHVFPMTDEEQEVSHSLPGELSAGQRFSFRGKRPFCDVRPDCLTTVGPAAAQAGAVPGRVLEEVALVPRLDRVREPLHRGRLSLAHADLHAAGIDG